MNVLALPVKRWGSPNKGLNYEYTQRSRSFLYVSIGAYVSVSVPYNQGLMSQAFGQGCVTHMAATPKDWYRLIALYLAEFAQGRERFEARAYEVWGLGEGQQERRRFEKYRIQLIAATRQTGWVKVGDYLVRFYSAASRNIHMHLVFVLDPEAGEDTLFEDVV